MAQDNLLAIFQLHIGSLQYDMKQFRGPGSIKLMIIHRMHGDRNRGTEPNKYYVRTFALRDNVSSGHLRYHRYTLLTSSIKCCTMLITVGQ